MAQPEEHGTRTRSTIREVASAAGVSIATVTRVLNGRPDVAPATREAVLRAVRDQRFTTNRNARAAVQHRLALGHRRIAALTGIPEWLASIERLNGYHSAHAAAGVLADPALVVEADYTIEGGEAGAAKLLDLPEPPTAIFAFNDNMAVAVLREARKRGLRVPEDVSVVGFDDSEPAKIVSPALTTVRQPL